MDSMYAGQISKQEAVKRWLSILASKNIRTRPDNHTLEIYSYFVYDKEEYITKDREKPLGLGIVYTKPNGVKTQDIIIIHPEDGLEIYYSEKAMIKKYPSMKGVHKKNLPPIPNSE